MNRLVIAGLLGILVSAAGMVIGERAIGQEKPPAAKPQAGTQKPPAANADVSKPRKDKTGKESFKATLPQRDPRPLVEAIDRTWSGGLSKAGIPPSPPADDAEFLRRVCLDLTGRIPSYQQTVAFLDSGSVDGDSKDKRRELIDDLLSSGDFGRHFGQRWRVLIQPRDTTSTKQSADRFSPWLAEQFNSNRPWNEVVTDLLTSEGDLTRDPRSTFLLAGSEELSPKPSLLAANAGRLFLGVQISCAECHNHPFAQWKQEDFWGLAAFFSRVHKRSKGDFTLTEELPADAAKEAQRGAILIPDGAGKSAGKLVAARLLDGSSPALADDQPLRPALAAWITSRENPFFARAMANRLWAHFFSRGIVHPVDDLREENPPANPELMQALASEFADSGFDVKHLVRCICNSQAYGRTSRPLAENQKDETLFSHMAVKVMTPEVLYDSLHVVVNAWPADPAPGSGKKPQKHQEVILEPRDAFVRFFARTADVDRGEQFAYGIPHMLRLMNGRELNPDPPFIAEQSAEKSPEELIKTIYLVVLSRQPSEQELRRMIELADEKERRYGDVVWVLLHSSEFVLNR